MKRRAFLVFCLGASTPSARRPNIVVILADDLGCGELSSTPHIDSITRNGVCFTDWYVSARYCALSRAGFARGLHLEDWLDG